MIGTYPKNPVRKVTSEEMRSNLTERRIRTHEEGHGFSSQDMVCRFDSVELEETDEILEWMRALRALRFLNEKTRTVWNTWDHLRTIHERLLAEHTFVDYSQWQTLDFETDAVEGATLLKGQAFCYRNVNLEVECWFNLRYFVNLLRARADSCRYSPWVQRGGGVVRYQNVHVYEDYYQS